MNKKEAKEIDEAAKKIVDSWFEEGEEKRKNFKEEGLKEFKKSNDSIGKQDHKKEGLKKVKNNTLRITAMEGIHAKYEIKKDGIEVNKNNTIVRYESVEEVQNAVKEAIGQIISEGDEIIAVFEMRDSYE